MICDLIEIICKPHLFQGPSASVSPSRSDGATYVSLVENCSSPQVEKHLIFMGVEVVGGGRVPSFPYENIAAALLYLNNCSGMEIKAIYFMLQFGNRCHIKLKASKSFNFENTHYERGSRNIVFAAGVHPFK